MSRTYDNFADLITFSRASRGTSVRRVRYGDELVTNGTFDSDVSGWNLMNANNILSWNASGYMDLERTPTGSTSVTNQNLTALVSGSLYVVEFEIISTSLTVNLELYDTNGARKVDILASASGVYNHTFLATADGVPELRILLQGASSGTATIDNISLKQFTLDDPDDPLLIYNHFDNEPRIDFDPVTGDRKGLLIEEARTNLITDSEVLDADSSEYTGKNLSATDPGIQDGTLAPDGVTQAYFSLESDALTSQERRLEVDNFLPTTSTTYTLSVFAKVKTDHVRRLGFRGFGAGSQNTYPVFDLVNGTVVNAGSSWSNTQIEDYGNGWYRCSSTVATASANSPLLHILADDADGSGTFYVGDTEGGLYLWGLQVEEGSFPTSYIPTSGSTVTRSADVASIATSAFGFNENEGTVFVEGRTSSSLISALFTINDNSVNNRISQRLTGSNVQAFIMDGGTAQASINVSNHIIGSFSKSALAYQENNFNNASQGTLGTADTSGTVASSLTQIELGTSRSPSNMLNGHIKKLQYFPRRLSDTELQEITS